MTIKIQDIKKGDTFWECESGFNDQYVATTDPWMTTDKLGDAWHIQGQGIGDEIVTFMSRPNYGAYAPKLYWQKAYI